MPNISTEHFLDGIIRRPECKENRALPVLWSSCYFATSFSSVLSNSPFHLSTQKPSGQDHSSLLITVRQTMKSLLSSVSCLWVVVEFWRMPARSAQRYKPSSATASAFLCLHLIPEPCCSLGSHRFVPTPPQIKMWVCSGWRCSKHSRGRTHAPFLLTAKWHKLLLLPVFQIHTRFSFRSKGNFFLLPHLRSSSWSQLHHAWKAPCICLCPWRFQHTPQGTQGADTATQGLNLNKQEHCRQRGWKRELLQLH